MVLKTVLFNAVISQNGKVYIDIRHLHVETKEYHILPRNAPLHLIFYSVTWPSGDRDLITLNYHVKL